MKTIIAGNRDYSLTDKDVEFLGTQSITEVISGGATDADRCGESWAESMGIPIRVFPANWAVHGKAAGPIRNREMAAYADRLICFWDGKSRGSLNMMEEARRKGIEVIVRLH
jgi:hypothetical protein